jgi:hypothetical protein
MGKTGVTIFKRFAMGWAGLVVARAAFAATPATEPVRLEYRAPAACADRASFVEAIRARTDRLREAGPVEEALTVRVTLSEADGGEVVGQLTSRDRKGVDSERTIHGTSCANVVSALALIVALAIDPEAAVGKKSPPPKPPPPVPKTRPSSNRPPPPPQRTHWEFGAQGSLHTAVAPDAMLAYGVYGRVARSGLSAKLSLQYGRQTARIADGGGKINWAFSHLEACPLEWRLSRGLALAPCADLEGGVVAVSGVDTPNMETVTRPWFVPGALVRLGIQPGFIAVTPEIGIGFPLIKDRYFIRPSTTVHQVRWVDFQGGLSVGLVLE